MELDENCKAVFVDISVWMLGLLAFQGGHGDGAFRNAKFLLSEIPPQSDDGEEEHDTASEKVVFEWELRLVLTLTVPAMTQIRA